MFERARVDWTKIPDVVRFKWSGAHPGDGEALLSEGFVAMPKRLLRCLGRVFGSGMGWDHLAAVLAVVDFKRRNLTRQPSVEYLAFLAGLDVQRFNACLTELVTAGLASVQVENGDETVVSIAGLVSRALNETASDLSTSEEGAPF